MKKVLFRADKNTINVENINSESFVGIVWKNDKSIVVKTTEGYTSLSNSTIDLSTYYSSSSSTLRNYVDKVKGDSHFKEAVVFESYKELLTWFSK